MKIACGHGCGNGGEGSCAGVGGTLLFSSAIWGHGGETRDTHTHTGTYTQMLHLPFATSPLKSAQETQFKTDFWWKGMRRSTFQ